MEKQKGMDANEPKPKRNNDMYKHTKNMRANTLRYT